jgi:hypothetical protein
VRTSIYVKVGPAREEPNRVLCLLLCRRSFRSGDKILAGQPVCCGSLRRWSGFLRGSDAHAPAQRLRIESAIVPLAHCTLPRSILRTGLVRNPMPRSCVLRRRSTMRLMPRRSMPRRSISRRRSTPRTNILRRSIPKRRTLT